MGSLPQVAEAMRQVLTTVADDAARTTGCVQRQRQFSGATLVQTLVLGWLAQPAASLDQLVHMAAIRGVPISAQGLDQRFTEPLAATLRQVLDAAVTQVVTSDPVAMPLLARFTGVVVQDSTTISLPAALASVWRGCGGTAGQGLAALKLNVRLDLRGGHLDGPRLAAGRTQDRTFLTTDAPLAPGSLWIGDLGFVTLARLRSYAAAGVYWLTRVSVQTVVYTADERRWTVPELLAEQTADRVEVVIRLGAAARLPARLLAVRVSADEADARRHVLAAQASRRQEPLTAARLALSAWTVVVTNAPLALLSFAEALVLARARWQIELLFKLWKQHGLVDEWRTTKPWRILCEVYAKLIGLVLAHWGMLLGGWSDPAHSLVKLLQVVRAHVVSLARALDQPGQVVAALTALGRGLRCGCRLNRRRLRPNTYQLLLDPALIGLS
jgi:hypothetical protein